MIKVDVNPGICGFHTHIEAEAGSKRNINLNIITECPNIKPMEKELKEADGFNESFAKVGDSSVFQLARKYCKHAACPVPTAIIKGIEAASGLALPRDVEIKIQKD